jgi:hypothetical protein
MKKQIIIGLGAILFMGCAYMKSNTHSVTRIETNGVQIVEQDTHSRAFTFMDANSTLAKFRNGSDKSTIGTNTVAAGTWASGLEQNSSSVGVSNIVSAALNLAVQAAMAGAK